MTTSDSVPTIPVALSHGATLVDSNVDTCVGPGTEPLTNGVDYASRYRLTGSLGSGGMGEVHLCRDKLIGRDIAVKVLRGSQQTNAESLERFLREAKIQGQLEHPSIVPVHDMGLTHEGRSYFTMKRVRGRTIQEVLEGLREGREEYAAAYSRRKLLTAFSTVCLAVELAHSRGVIHRDLKPANIMLGDFGEVYVLDWGIARLAATQGLESDRPSEHIVANVQGGTQTGAVLGTPGYMAPEQVRGDVAALGPRADVYSLGAVLFEILTFERLHPESSIEQMLASALAPADARASIRAPGQDVPPELEAVCVRATALRASDRFASARDVANAVDRFLDGDRDLARRRELAAVHAASAESLTVEALSRTGALESRRKALAETSRALALDPMHATARRVMVRLLTMPPVEVPPEAAAALDQSALETQRFAGRMGGTSYACWLLIGLPLGLAMGITNSWSFALFAGAHALACLTLFWLARSRTIGGFAAIAAMIASFTATGSIYLAFGNLVLLPAVTVATMAVMLLNPRAQLKMRLAITALAATLVVLPSLLEVLRVIPPSLVFQSGTMTLLPRMVRFNEVPTLATLGVAGLMTVLALAYSVSRLRVELTRAERALQLQAWQLAQLVPADVSA